MSTDGTLVSVTKHSPVDGLIVKDVPFMILMLFTEWMNVHGRVQV